MGLFKKRFLLLVGSLAALGLTAALMAATASAAGRPAATGSKGTAGAKAVAGHVSKAQAPSGDCSISEGFDDITALTDWAIINHSEPLGATDWFQGNDTVFPSHSGDPTSYIAANFNNTGDNGTISDWLLTPVTSIQNGGSVTFWTRTVTPGANIYPDRLQVRASTAGSSTNVGTSSTDVGDFTQLLLDINPTYSQDGYPFDWTQFTATITGVPEATTGRFAFRYFVEDAGLMGTNSNYIGIDDACVSSSSGPPPPPPPPPPAGWQTVAPLPQDLFGGASATDGTYE